MIQPLYFPLSTTLQPHLSLFLSNQTLTIPPILDSSCIFIFFNFSKPYLFHLQHSSLGLHLAFIYPSFKSDPSLCFWKVILKLPCYFCQVLFLFIVTICSIFSIKALLKLLSVCLFHTKFLNSWKPETVHILFAIVPLGLNVRSREGYVLRIYLQNKQTGRSL